jgi:hypothetical protein
MDDYDARQDDDVEVPTSNYVRHSVSGLKADQMNDQSTQSLPWQAWGKEWGGLRHVQDGPGTRMDHLLQPEQLVELGQICESSPQYLGCVTVETTIEISRQH